jgi:hypothetical protein
LRIVADARYSRDSTFPQRSTELRRFAAKNFHAAEDDREKFSVAARESRCILGVLPFVAAF